MPRKDYDDGDDDELIAKNRTGSIYDYLGEVSREWALIEAASEEPKVELYARVGYTYSKSGGWSHKDGTVSAKISGVDSESVGPAADWLKEILKTLSVLSEQHASAEITRRNQHGADGPTSEIVAGDAEGVSGE